MVTGTGTRVGPRERAAGMTTFRFDWSDWVTPALLDELREAAGIDAGVSMDTLIPRVARCLASAGGLPLVRDAVPGADERTATARSLLYSALRHAAVGKLRRPKPDGLTFEPSSEPMLARRARAWTMVEVNLAAAAEFDALPGIGALIAQRIVAERLERGPFKSARDLAERVPGLGMQRLQGLRSVLSYALPQAIRWAPHASGAWQQDLRALLAQQPGPTALARLQALMEQAASICSGNPSPDTRARRIRGAEPPPPQATLVADWVSVLFGSDYVGHLLELFVAAAGRLDVLMFHIALGRPGHPTRQLLEALIAAKARGVAVRVLVDRDRDTDPYRSTVINTPAARLLHDAGIEVRADSHEQLMHSKAVAIDGALLVLGSHNWSAGSYFNVDDLSLAVRSQALATQFHERFDGLWALAQPIPG